MTLLCLADHSTVLSNFDLIGDLEELGPSVNISDKTCKQRSPIRHRRLSLKVLYAEGAKVCSEILNPGNVGLVEIYDVRHKTNLSACLSLGLVGSTLIQIMRHYQTCHLSFWPQSLRVLSGSRASPEPVLCQWSDHSVTLGRDNHPRQVTASALDSSYDPRFSHCNFSLIELARLTHV
ncbi:hypothetical protein RRG08_035206 [Elysia crispata]|uniref:Uncharacterized protein n=1 Tax=Elysia crispata TaxID=231223 RepID=A0AAE0ZMZ3_9GAST|nr:hypothetical protein RRG08_035206 [Elysia crispata]